MDRQTCNTKTFNTRLSTYFKLTLRRTTFQFKTCDVKKCGSYLLTLENNAHYQNPEMQNSETISTHDKYQKGCQRLT